MTNLINNRYSHTLRQLINTTIVNIASHPLIKEPVVYYPIVTQGAEPEPVKIERYRTYDGIELIEPGLTLAVFPAYSSKTFNTGFRSSLFNSVKLKPYTMGSKNTPGFLYEVTYYIAVALYYSDVSINNSITVNYLKQDNRVVIYDKSQTFHPPDLIDKYTDFLPEENTLEIEINPAEDILRDYMDVLRIVLDDIPRLYPFSLRYTSVDTMDFPTTSWLRDNKDVYFHTSYLMWEVGGYLTTELPIDNPSLLTLNIQENVP